MINIHTRQFQIKSRDSATKAYCAYYYEKFIFKWNVSNL